MRKKRRYQVITFHTTAAAMAMEKFCVSNQLPGRLIPVPREISAGCGLAWRVEATEFSEQRARFEEIPVEIEATVELLL